MSSKVKYLAVFSLFVLLAACSDVDEQSDINPVAMAEIIGATSNTSATTMRSGTDVLVTAQNSDGVDDPIISFEIEASSVTGDPSVSLEDINGSLFERTVTTKLFRSPTVTMDTTVEFRVEVVDADGKQAEAFTSVTVLPLGDNNTFLAQDGVDDNNLNQYELVVALDLEPAEVTNSTFQVQIDTIAEWQPISTHADCTFGTGGNLCQMVLSTETISGEWESGLSQPLYTAGVTMANASFNPKFLIDLPSVNVDDINRFFETADREKRLSLANVPTARAYHQYTFVSSDNSAQLVILDDSAEDSGLTQHSYRQSSPSSAPSALVDTDEIRLMNKSESIVSGLAYNYLLDPNGQASTVEEWKTLRGFVAGVENETEFAHALYVNNFDLGFGRDMFMRTDECGNVYSYVENYPSLELALRAQGNFATVVMEYSPLNPGTPGNCSSDEKFVKFFAYVPDIETGEEVIMPTMNFDGRGEKSVPGVCTSCHAGNPNRLVDFVSSHYQNSNATIDTLFAALDALTDEQKIQLVDIGATFMPFDLDSFLYTEASEDGLQDPFYSRTEITDDQVALYSRETQLSSFTTLNKGALRTFLDKRDQIVDPDPLDNDDPRDRWDAPIELVNLWYGTNVTSLQDLDDLDGQVFDGTATPDGWLADPDLYHNVFARNCRACHVQIENTTINFDVIDEFIDVNGPLSARLEETVFDRGVMPMARLTMDRFWVDFDGETSASDLLRTYLNVTESPGRPVANLQQVTAESAFFDLGSTIEFSTAASFGQIESTVWNVSNDCGDSSFITGLQTSTIRITPEVSPCEFRVSADVSNAIGTDSSNEITFNVDRVPSAVSASASLASFEEGDSQLLIDIDSLIIQRGDNLVSDVMSVIVNDAQDPDFTAIDNNISNNLDGTISYEIPIFDSVSSIPVQYKVADSDGSVSNLGIIAVSKPAVGPENISISNTVSQATIEFEVPDAFSANASAFFIIERDGPSLDGSFDQVVRADIPTFFSTGDQSVIYTDSGLVSNGSYQYRVQLELSSQTSAPVNSGIISTVLSVPAFSFSTITDSSIQLSITPANGSSPSGYRVKRYLGSNNNGSPALNTVVSANSNPRLFNDTGLTANQAYTYEVIAIENGAESESTEAMSAKTLPAAPTSFSAMPNTSNVQFSWSSSNEGAVTFNLQRAVANSNSFTNYISGINGTSVNSLNNEGTTEFDYRVVSVGTDLVGSQRQSDPSTVLEDIRREYSFSTDIYDAFFETDISNTCQGCHSGGGASFGDFRLAASMTDSEVLTELREFSSRRLNASLTQYIVNCVNNGCGAMSDGNATDFTASEVSAIEAWISDGAQD